MSAGCPNNDQVVHSLAAMKQLRVWILVIVVVGLLGYGGFGLWQWYWATNQPVPVAILDGAPVERSIDNPSETPIDPKAKYTVPADIPRQIVLPSINTQGFIQRVGIDQNKAVAVPTNIHLVGWYVNSAKPGHEGLSIIDGHVGGRYGDAVFKHLNDLKAGDEFTVEYGDYSKKTFAVMSVKTLSVAEATQALFTSDSSVKNQLNLITCGGAYDAKTNQFNQRVIVTAKLIT